MNTSVILLLIMLTISKVNNAENHLNECFPDDSSSEDLIYFEFAPIILMETIINLLKDKYLSSIKLPLN